MRTYSFISFLFLCGLSSCTSPKAEDSTESATKSTSTEATTNLISLSHEQMQTIGVQVGEVAQRELTATVKATGVVSVLNQNKAMITSLFSGTIKNILVHQGDQVAAGTPIATLVHPNLIAIQEEYLTIRAQLEAGSPEAVASVANSQYANLEEQYNTLQPQIALAEKEVKRQKELNAGNAGSGKNLQQAESELATFQAKSLIIRQQMAVFSKNANTILQTRLAALENKLKVMGITPSSLNSQNIQPYLTIKSPIAGRVGEIQGKIGSFVGENTSIAEVIDLQNLHLDLHVYEADLPHFHKNQIFDFTLAQTPQKTYSAKVHTLGAMLDPQTKTVEVHAHIEGDKTGLLEGMSVVAMIHQGKNKVTAVPNGAIASEGGSDYIFIQQQTSSKEVIFTKTPVRKGASELGFTEIIPATPIPPDAKIALSQAFFIMGKMTNTGEE